MSEFRAEHCSGSDLGESRQRHLEALLGRDMARIEAAVASLRADIADINFKFHGLNANIEALRSTIDNLSIRD